MGGVPSYNVSVNRVLPLNVSLLIGAELYFNDTANNWNTAETTLTTTGDVSRGMDPIILLIGMLIVGGAATSRRRK